ncbi:MAG: hypothetical protein HY676_01915, partial [Chloroflexi bacterium]|nr:hypothetical protein [Chloroflexota bacterium]
MNDKVKGEEGFEEEAEVHGDILSLLRDSKEVVDPQEAIHISQPVDEEVEEEWTDEKAVEEVLTEGAPEEVEEEQELEAELEGADVIDDPVRMYLREIGRVSLLTAKDERVLARRIEHGKYVGSLRKELSEITGIGPNSSQIAETILKRLAGQRKTVQMLAEKAGISGSSTLSQIASHADFHSLIDGEMDPELVTYLSTALNMEPAQVAPAIVSISLNSSLLSNTVVRVLREDSNLEQVEDRLSQPGVLHRLKQCED